MASRVMWRLIAVLMLLAVSVEAETYTFQQGVADVAHPELGVYEGAHDVTITESTSWLNTFGESRLRMQYTYPGGPEGYNTLIRFDNLGDSLSGLIVGTATLTLTYRHEYEEYVTPTIDIYPALKSWADPNATWVYADSGEGEAWQAGGAAGEEDRGDLSTSVTLPARSFMSYYDDGDRFELELDPGLVQGWIADPNSNLGLIMAMNPSAATDITFSSSQYSELEDRPLLTIETVPCLAIPSDLTGDCYVNFDDYVVLSRGWQSGEYAMEDLIQMANEWLECSDPDEPRCTWTRP